MKKYIFLIAVSFSFSKLLAQDSYNASYEVIQIPKVKAYHIKGTITIFNNSISFKPDESHYFKEVNLIADSIISVSLYTILFKNRVLVKTSSEVHSFYSKNSKLLHENLREKMHYNEKELLYKAFLLKRIPFVFPIVLDYNFEGIIRLDEREKTITYYPTASQKNIQQIEIDVNQIKKVRTRPYWLIPRNILKIKLKDGSKFKFTVLQPKQLKSEVVKLM